MTCTFAITDPAYTLPVVDLFSIKFNVENWNNKFDFLYYTHGKEGKIVSKKNALSKTNDILNALILQLQENAQQNKYWNEQLFRIITKADTSILEKSEG